MRVNNNIALNGFHHEESVQNGVGVLIDVIKIAFAQRRVKGKEDIFETYFFEIEFAIWRLDFKEDIAIKEFNGVVEDRVIESFYTSGEFAGDGMAKD